MGLWLLENRGKKFWEFVEKGVAFLVRVLV